MFKSLVIAAPVMGTALYFSGALDFGSFPRTVDGSPEQVMAELADLDIREQPGSPGSTAQQGVTPRFRLVRGKGRMDWQVMSGSQIATTMTATFEPVDGGARTRITAYVERGDAPDARISPAFRSAGLTQGLFESALSTELDEMIAGEWGPECDAIQQELLAGPALYAEGAAMEAADNAAEGIAAVGKAAVGIARIRRQLIERGCNPDAPNPLAGRDGFVPVRDTLSRRGGGAAAAGWAAEGTGDEGDDWGR